ncbi:clavesin-2-like [Neocloeon triangulifer]|uniref:clavesin-2-like n=1 Tax=Neocloeon triangulifer TaxID=2078957 RepID=UPI00286EC0B6|nr:clavesin-2-like [Neocloeon triangulifer]XP_059469137.1 clavesin-2-like [Neocloeon triangulifer]XP_059469138.1 clavesin-2-like [Neocloeon triangulifer]
MAEYMEYQWNLANSATESDLLARPPILSKHQAISAVRGLLPSRPDVGFLCTEDEFLLRFLNARKFKIEDSFNLLVNYYLYRQRYRHLFIGLNVQDPLIRRALFDGIPGVLPQCDKRGRRVLVIYANNWDIEQYSLLTIYRGLLLSLEKLIQDQQTQMAGLIVIVDWSGFTLRHTGALSPKALKLMLEGLQDAFPARFKAIHMIGQPWYLEAALSVIKPFLKEKTRNKIFLHGANLSKLHEYVDKELLPAELGGEGPGYHAGKWAEELIGTSLDPALFIQDEQAAAKAFKKSQTFSGTIQEESC